LEAADAGARPAPSSAPASLPDDLTQREAEVLSLVAEGQAVHYAYTRGLAK
jgi:DNA-binding NarL/FixJ family response regulator